MVWNTDLLKFELSVVSLQVCFQAVIMLYSYFWRMLWYDTHVFCSCPWINLLSGTDDFGDLFGWSFDPLQFFLEEFVTVLVHLELTCELGFVDHTRFFLFLFVIFHLHGNLCVAGSQSFWSLLMLMSGFSVFPTGLLSKPTLGEIGLSVSSDILGPLLSQLAFQYCIFLTKCMALVGQPLSRTVSEPLSRDPLDTFRVLHRQHFRWHFLRVMLSLTMMDRCILMDGCRMMGGRCLLNVFFAFPFSRQCYSLKRLKVYNILNQLSYLYSYWYSYMLINVL